ncbi:class I SAM-dependent DNA methyltransferase [Anderseniella sp. Alg231-50]|uniref:class I SAM-dependent DNA methyltransferase n=1 Tax=Anderseniella sp. Alg231-50 TaxID=1922226 RepID=UPI00307B8FCA
MNGDSEKARRNLRRARAITGSDDARSVYAEWAISYDRDVFSTLKVTGTDTIADLLCEHTADIPGARVLDAGCGTGAVAARLKIHGFDQIDGVDLSPDMLKIARSKALYRTLIEADLNRSFDLPHSPYTAIVSAGTFTTGHVGAAGFQNLFAHLAANGLMACVIANPVWARDQFDALIDTLPAEVLSNQVKATIPDGEPDAHMLVLRRSR